MRGAMRLHLGVQVKAADVGGEPRRRREFGGATIKARTCVGLAMKFAN